MKKTVFITGASQGLGKTAAKRFAAEGWNVIASMRSPEKENELTLLDNILVIKVDVQDKASIEAGIATTIAQFGKIDVLINNAGYGLFGAFELATDEQIRTQFDVNVFGLMNATRAVLPHFRSNKAGTIINISSMGGRVSFPVISLYNASKFAVEGFTEALQYELAPFNISLKLIEPGVIATNFDNAANFTANNDITDYNDYVNAFLGHWMSLNPNPATSEQVVDVVYTAATDGKKQLRYIATPDAELMIHARETKTEADYLQWMKDRHVPAAQ